MTARTLIFAGTLLTVLTLPRVAAGTSTHDNGAALASDGEPVICQYVGDPVSEWICVGVIIDPGA